MSIEVIPPPDHPDANAQGCSCMRSLNKNGEGEIVDGIREYTVSPSCRLHSDTKWWMSHRRKSNV
jgi:hypothetical protein